MEEQENNAETDTKIEKSAITIYKELVRQYDLEMDAQDTLKDKANGLMVINGTIITLITLVMIQLVNLVVTYKISLLLVIIPYLLLLLSLYNGIESYLPRGLQRISAGNLHKYYYRKPKTDILEQLSSNIAYSIDNNQKITDIRSQFVERSIMFFKFGIISFVVVLIIISAIHYKSFYNLL